MTPLLWVLRDNLGITSVKYTCGIAECGMCTVLIDGEAQRSCVVNVEDVQGSDITTIEGLPDNHPVKVAWIEKQVPQCGYCQPGIMLQTVDFLSRDPIRPMRRSTKPWMMSSAGAVRIQGLNGDQAGCRNDRQTGGVTHANRNDEKILF
jgi:aerobic-type carbon monoxide dehydrogenase small subunit (CoxS/CutS family)